MTLLRESTSSPRPVPTITRDECELHGATLDPGASRTCLACGNADHRVTRTYRLDQGEPMPAVTDLPEPLRAARRLIHQSDLSSQGSGAQEVRELREALRALLLFSEALHMRVSELEALR